MAVAALVFEGGPAAVDELDRQISRLRHAVALDTLATLLTVTDLDPVLLVTNHSDLAVAASALGARVAAPHLPFHFGAELQRQVAATGRQAAVCLSGTAGALLGASDWQWIVDRIQTATPCVVVNNPQSADIVAWAPAAALDRIAPPAMDNWLGYLLQADAGLPRVLMPHSAATHFDLDTPTDYLVLAETGRAGPRLGAALAGLEWDRSRVRAIAALVGRDLAELALIGRVGTAVVDYLNATRRLRLRVFAEERGMKALGREEQGLVRSFIADVIGELGPERVFRQLLSSCDGIVMDTRVAFAHGGRRVTARDRFRSDLGLVREIQDPWVRALTAAAIAAPRPVLLGGHGVVAGSLWLLGEGRVAPGGAVQITSEATTVQRAQEWVRRHIPAERSLSDELIAERRQEGESE